jgi:hypothetical protein
MAVGEEFEERQMRRGTQLGLLGLLFVLAAVLHGVVAAGDSATEDEGVHLYAGVVLWDQGRTSVNLEHPPLAKLLAGAALRMAGTGSYPAAETWEGRQYAEAVAQFSHATEPALARKLAYARLPFLILTFLLAALVAFLSAALSGRAASVAAAAVFLFMPLVIAMGHLVHTDLPVAFFLTAAFAVPLLLASRPENSRAMIPLATAGAFLGLALLTKFSALIFVPFLALALALLPARHWRERLLSIAIAGVVAAGVLWGGMTVAFRSADAAYAARVAEALNAPVAGALMAPPLTRPLGFYAAGLETFLQRGELAVNYFAGDFSTRGWWFYFPLAFLLKTPLPFLLLLVITAVVRWKRGFDRVDLMLLLPVGGYLFVSMGSTYNIGVRHLLPVFPFLIVWVSRMFAASGRQAWPAGAAARRLCMAGAALVAGLAASTLAAAPHYVGYFNLLAGGRETATFILSDSNVDWGQDNRRLYARLSERDLLPATTLLMGGAFPELELGPGVRPLEPRRPPEPGVYAISRALLVELVAFAALPADHPFRRSTARHSSVWFTEPYAPFVVYLLEHGELIGTIGNSIDIYRLE